MDEKAQIAIIGYWSRLCGCVDNEEFTQNYLSPKDAALQRHSAAASTSSQRHLLTELRDAANNLSCNCDGTLRSGGLVDRKEMFDNEYFDIRETEALSMDPQQRISLQGVIHALEHAGITKERISEINPSVYCSSWSNEYEDLLEECDQYRVTGNMGSIIAGRVAHHLNSRGVNLCVESACSSSMSAIQQAVNAIKLKQTKMAIVIATNTIGERSTKSINASRMLSPDGILKAFDCDADGYVRSEGFSVVILSTEELAKEHDCKVYGLITNIVSNSDGKTKSLVSPSQSAQTENLLNLLPDDDRASCPLIIAHGTGTKVGDSAECGSIKHAFPDEIIVATPKSSLGHNEACSGLTGIIFAINAINIRYVSPQSHLKLPIQELRRKRTMFIGQELEADNVVLNSFGLGGTNVSLVLELQQMDESYKERRNLDVIFLSAHDEKSLDMNQETWESFLSSSSSTWNDTLYSNHSKSSMYPVRRCFRGSNRKSLLRKIQTDNRIIQLERIHFSNKVCVSDFQWMLDFQLESAKFFHQVASETENLYIREKENSAALRTFLLSAVWMRIVKNMGLTPQRVSGEGVGLLSAMYYSGYITLEDAVHLIIANQNGTWEYELRSTKFRDQLMKLEGDYGSNFDFSMLSHLEFNGSGHSISGFDRCGGEHNLISKEGIEKVAADIFISGRIPKIGSSGVIAPLPKYHFNEFPIWPCPKDNKTSGCASGNSEEESIRFLENLFVECGYNAYLSDPIEWSLFDSLHLAEFKESIHSHFGLNLSYESLTTFQAPEDFNKFIVRNCTRRRKISPIVSTATPIRVGIAHVEFSLPSNIDHLSILTDRLLTGFSQICSSSIQCDRNTIKTEFDLTLDELDCLSDCHLNVFNCLIRVKKRGYDFTGSPLVYAVPGSLSGNEKNQNCSHEMRALGVNASIAAGRAAAYIGCTGNVSVVQNACTSVYDSIQLCSEYMYKIKATYGVVLTSQIREIEDMKSDFTKCFDMDRCGYTITGGAGVIILSTKESEMILRIENLTNKFAGSVFTPNISIYTDLLRSMSRVSYLECHGTATEGGDSFEGESIFKSWFKGIVGSIKSNIGHNETASGLCQLLNILSITNTSTIPQQLHLVLPEENIRKSQLIRLPFVNEEQSFSEFGICCYGLSGGISAMTLQTINPSNIYNKNINGYTFMLRNSSHTSNILLSKILSLHEIGEREPDYSENFTESQVILEEMGTIIIDLCDICCFLDFYTNSRSFMECADYLVKHFPDVVDALTTPIIFAISIIRMMFGLQSTIKIAQSSNLVFTLNSKQISLQDMNDWFFNYNKEDHSNEKKIQTFISLFNLSPNELFLSVENSEGDSSKVENYQEFIQILCGTPINSNGHQAIESDNEKYFDVTKIIGHLINGKEILSGSYLLSLLCDRKYIEEIYFVCPVSSSSEMMALHCGDHCISYNNQNIVLFKESDFAEIGQEKVEFGNDPVTHFNGEEIYDVFRKNFYNYQNGFECIARISTHGEKCGRFVVKCSHPSFLILEAALQAPVFHHLHAINTIGTPLLPFSIEKLAFHQPHFRNASHGIYFITNSERNKLWADIFLMDEDGENVATMKEVLFLSQRENIDFGGGSPPSENTIHGMTSITTWIEKQCNIVVHEPTTGFFELGLNSLLISYMHKHLKQEFPFLKMSDVFDHPSPSSLANFLDIHRQPGKKGLEPSQGKILSSSIPQITQNISIAGFACRFPGSISDPKEFWDMLKSGRDCNISIPQSRISTRHDLLCGKKYGRPVEGGYFCGEIDKFDNEFFNLSKSEAEVMDPQHRLILECAFECLHNCNVQSSDNVGVFIGLMGTEYPDLMRDRTDVLSMLSSATSVISGRLNFMLNSRGPSQTIDTACSSSLVALDSAIKSLKNGECSRALVGGVNLIINENGMGQRANGGMLSPNGICSTFDASASGYGRADGCVMMLIEKTNDCAITVENICTNHCGHGASLTSPNGLAQMELLRMLIEPNESKEIEFWEAHGTATNLGDPIEVNVLAKALRNAVISSGKASYGHGEAAAAASAILKCSKQMEHGYIPPQLHFSALNKHIDINRLTIPSIGCEAELGSCGISSFGISGTNAACILKRISSTHSCMHEFYPYYVIPIVAKNRTALAEYKEKIYKQLAQTDECIYCISSMTAKLRYKCRDCLIVDQNRREVKEITNIDEIWIADISFDLLLHPKIRHLFLQTIRTCQSINVSLGVAIIQFFEETTSASFAFKTNNPDLCIAYALHKRFIDDAFVELLQGSSISHILNWVKSHSAYFEQLHAIVEWKADTILDFSKMMNLLGGMFVNGIDIEWENIYNSSQVTPLSLPNHPYDKKRLWCTKETAHTLDAFLGQKIVYDNGHIIYENKVNVQRFSYLLRMSNAAVVFDVAHRVLKDLDKLNSIIQIDRLESNSTVDDGVSMKIVWNCQNENITIFFAGKLFAIVSILKNINLDLPRTQEILSTPLCIDRTYPHAQIIKKNSRCYEVETIHSANMVSTIVDLLNKSGYGVSSVVMSNNFANPLHIEVGTEIYLKNADVEIGVLQLGPKQETTCRPDIAHQQLDLHPQVDEMGVIHKKILRILSEVATRNIATERVVTFADAGLDSLGIVDFVNRINIEFCDIEITTTDVFEYENIESLAKEIHNRLTDTLPPMDPVINTLQNDSTIIKHKPFDDNSESGLSMGEFSTDEPVLMYSIKNTEEDSKKQCEVKAEFDENYGFFELSSSNGRIWANSTHLNLFFSTFPDGSTINLEISCDVPVENNFKLFEAIVHFVEAISGYGFHFILYINDDQSAVLTAGFKTIASERYPEIQFNWNERLVPIPMEMTFSIQKQHSSLNWLVTGGLSGIGWCISEHLAIQYRASNIVLISRRRLSDALKSKIEKMGAQTRCKFFVISCDISKFQRLKNSLLSLNFKINGIVHSAGLIADALTENQNANRLRAVFEPKVVGMQNLERIEKIAKWNLKHFICMSSISSILGNRGQLNYSVANALMDSMIRHRRLKGLCGQTINWGNWVEIGMAMRVNKRLMEQGFVGLSTTQALHCFDFAMTTHQSQVVVANIDWKSVLLHRPDIPNDIVNHNSEFHETSHDAVGQCQSSEEYDSDESSVGESFSCSEVDENHFFLEKYELNDNLLRFQPQKTEKGNTVIMFGGQGTQYPFLGMQLISTYPIFRYYYERLLEEAENLLGINQKLINILVKGSEQLYSTKIGQVIVFCCGVAVFELWKWMGVTVDYVVGHSIGELTAFAVSGTLSYRDALKIVIARGKMMEELEGTGSMFVTSSKAMDSIQQIPNVYLAAVNSKKQIAVSCTNEGIYPLLSHLKNNNYPVRLINDEYPFHAPLIARKAINEFEKEIAKISLSRPTIPLYSAMTNNFITQIDHSYFSAQAMSTVHFKNAVSCLESKGVTRWIDAGPNNVLEGFVKVTVTDVRKHIFASTTKSSRCELRYFLSNADHLLSNTYEEDFEMPEKLSFISIHRDLSLISQHRIKKTAIVPATYMIYRIHQALCLLKSRAVVGIHNITFPRVWEANHRTVLVDISEGGVKLISPIGELFHCGYSLEKSKASDKKFVQNHLKNDVNIQSFYSDMDKMHLHYGRRYQCISEIRIEGNKVQSTIEINEFETLREAIILEGAMHTLLTWVWNSRKGVYCIPIAIRLLAMHGELPIVFNQISVEGTIVSNNSQFIEASVEIFIDGKIYCRIEGMTAKCISTQSLDVKPQNEDFTANSKATEGVSVYGCAGIFAGNAGSNRTHLWDSLKSGNTNATSQRTGIKLCKLINKDVTLFDPETFQITPHEGKYIDPQLRLIFKSVLRALEDSRISSLPTNTGVFVGASTSEFSQLALLRQSSHDAPFGLGTHPSALAGRISHWLQIIGPSMVIDTACSSSLVALTTAAEYIRRQQCEYAIVCGVNVILHEKTTNVLLKSKMLSPNGICRAFDANADGYVRGEAAVCIIIGKEEAHLPILSSWATRHTGQSSAVTVPKSSSQIELMKSVGVEGVDLVECHMTGTSLGDPIEVNSIMKAASTASLMGVKSMLGHCEAAAGLVSLVSALCVLQAQYVPPQLHLSLVNRQFPTDPKLHFIGCERKVDKVLINSFGFTGSNACVMLSRPTTRPSRVSAAVHVYFFLLLSAHSNDQLMRYIAKAKRFVQLSSMSLSAIENKLNFQRRAPLTCFLCYNYRRQFVEMASAVPLTRSISRCEFDQLRHFCLYGSRPTADSNQNQFAGVPGIPLMQTQHWPFEDDDGNSNDSKELHDDAETKKLKGLFFKRQLFKNSWLSFKKVDFSHIHDIEQEIGENNLLSNNVHILFPHISTILEKIIPIARNVTKLFHDINATGGGYCVISKENDSTSNLELSSLLRTLAAEYPKVVYKLIVYETELQLSQELSDASRNEIVIYKNNVRYVERLVREESTAIKMPIFKSILITGGTGGLGKIIGSFYNPASLYILSRRRPRDTSSNVTWIKCDVSDGEQLDASLSQIPHVDAIFHLAGSVRNKLSQNLSDADFRHVFNPKVDGMLNLIQATRHLKSARFVVFSSVAAVLGSYGQLNYALANGIMTWIAESCERQIDIVHLGPVANVGMLSGKHMETIRKCVEDNGWKCMLSATVAEAVAEKMTGTERIIFDCEFEKVLLRQPHLRNFCSEVCRLKRNGYKSQGKNNNVTPPHRCKQYTCQSLIDMVHSISEISSLESKSNIGLMVLGMDSLMMEELRQRVETFYNIVLPSSELFDNPSVSSLWNLVQSKMSMGKECEEVEGASSNKETESDRSSQNSNGIAIVGYSLVASGSATSEELWQHLIAGEECITIEDSTDSNIIRAAGIAPDCQYFDHEFWGIPEKEAASIDPQLRVFLEQAYKALEHSGVIKEVNNFKVGIFAGSEPSEYGYHSTEAKGGLMRMFRSNTKDFVSTWTAYHLNLQGPAVGIYSACSTFITAMQQACHSLNNGEIDLAIVGASSLVLPDDIGYEYEPGMVLSSDGHCRPFTENSDGTVRGSAVGSIVLQKCDKAKKNDLHVHGIIKAIGLSNDGKNKASFLAPNSRGQQQSMEEALANVSREDLQNIAFVECHGTGTKVGDAMELKALSKAYRHNIRIGSSKANFGHGYAGAGLISVVKLLKMLKHREIPPQINFKALPNGLPYSHIKVNCVATCISSDSLVSTSCFGIGGTNGHLILGADNLSKEEDVIKVQTVILPISGKTLTSCIQNVRVIAQYLRNDENINLPSVSKTLMFRREQFRYRCAVVAKDTPEAIVKLDNLTKEDVQEVDSINSSDLVFLFAPQGTQYNNMLHDCRNEDFPIFHDTLNDLIRKATLLTKTDFQ